MCEKLQNNLCLNEQVTKTKTSSWDTMQPIYDLLIFLITYLLLQELCKNFPPRSSQRNRLFESWKVSLQGCGSTPKHRKCHLIYKVKYQRYKYRCNVVSRMVAFWALLKPQKMFLLLFLKEIIGKCISSEIVHLTELTHAYICTNKIRISILSKKQRIVVISNRVRIYPWRIINGANCLL